MSNMTREEENELLRKNSAMQLPDNPSAKQWSPSQLKRILSNGLFLLKDWLDDLRNDVGNSVTSVNYSAEDQIITFSFKDGTTESFEMGSGNANIYYDDTLPQDTSKLKSGDLYFDE